MKKVYAALFAATLGFAANAQSFNAAEWGKDGQTFNGNQEFEYSEVDNTLTVNFTAAENNGLRRAEIANTVPVTLGGENTIVVFKVTYSNAAFMNFDKNMIYVRRQMRNTLATDETTEYLAPYFITNQNSNAGRIAANNKPEDTEAYYWRYLPGLSNEAANTKSAPDWATPFEVPSSFSNSKKFTFNDQDTWGYSYLGIRLNHSADAADAETAPGKLDDNASATFNYIGITSLAKLGCATAEEFTALSSANQGKKVKTYIDALIAGVEGVSANDADAAAAITVNGNTVTAQGAALEAYNIAGQKIAAAAEEVTLPAGIYVVKATIAGNTTVAKVIVK